MNLINIFSRRNLFSLIFPSLIILMVILCFNEFSRNERAYAKSNSNSIQNCSNDSLFYATVSVNGDTSNQPISYVRRDQLILIDAHLFFDIVGGHYFPMGQNFGLTVQYGKIISFALNNYQQGFVACKMVDMLPPAEAINNTIMAPINFLADAIGGQVDFIEVNQHLDITTSAPSEIGDIIPEAKSLSDALSQQNYTIRQGAINLLNAIDLYVAGYQSDCNGNNANYPYLMTQTPPCPEVTSVSSIPLFYTMRPDEAFVLIGRTPPQCTYYSYRSYLYSRYYDDESPHRKKIYASLGDTQSLYNMSEGRTVPDSFNRFFMLISAADKNITAAIRSAAIASGIRDDDIYVDVIPADIVRMGLDEQADFFNFFHRAVLFNDPADNAQYTSNPPLEFMRITPNVAATPDYLPAPTLRQRGTGTTEFHLNDGLAQLRQQLINNYSATYDAIDLVSYQWLPEGYEAIKTRSNVRGETRDALYLRTPFFEFQEHDIIVVFGVNHAKTGKATYCNVGCYGVPALNGLGGVSNQEFQGTAHQFLSDSSLADSLYVWKFARTQIDSQTFVIPPDVNHDYTGLDYGAIAAMLFRLYVEPAAKVGPVASEVIMDRAILFRPKATGLQEKQFMYAGKMRSYLVHEPLSSLPPKGRPLVLGLHAQGATVPEFIVSSGLIKKADTENFLVVFPNALPHPVAQIWNAGGTWERVTRGTDDVGFLAALIDTLIKNYHVDTTRIYSTGHSGGGMMSYRLAAEFSRRIAAIGPVSGQMVYEYCDPEFPVPIIHFHGLADTAAPYQGRYGHLYFPPVDSALGIWREKNDCQSIPDTIFQETKIVGKKWASSGGHGDIVLYTIEGWGHGWPQSSTAGISATDVIWDFLKIQTRSGVTSVERDDSYSTPVHFQLYQNYPNPFNPATRIKYQLAKSSHVELKIYNLAGQEIATLVNELQAAGEYDVTWQSKGLPSGVYFYRLQAGGFSETKKLILQK
jgi:poly(3-hydroxybutyrate) depolymerase